MRIDLPSPVADEFRDLAARQGREVRALLMEALRQYLDSVAITDLDQADVAETQSALLRELPDVGRWKTTDE